MMKMVILFAMFVIWAGTGMLIAHEEKAPTTAPTTQESSAEPVNKLCPVHEEKVNPEVFVIYEGKKIAFCCEDCVEPFKKDPKKYVEKMK